MKRTRRGKPHHLTPYRRHYRGCTGTNPLTCDCPLWAHGRINGKFRRISLGTRSLASAEERIKQLLNPDAPPDPEKVVPIECGIATVENAAKDFLNGKRLSGAAESTLISYEILVDHFIRFAASHRISYLRDVTPQTIRQFFAANENLWKSQRTRAQRLVVLRTWMHHCVDQGWIVKSPAAGRSLSFKPAADQARTPFSREEVDQILSALDQLKPGERPRARALILLMLFSGMRVSDAAMIQRAAVHPQSCMLDYRMVKNRRHIQIPITLPPDVVEALEALPGKDTFYFWPGNHSAAIQMFDAGRELRAHLPRNFYLNCVETMSKHVIGKLLGIAGVKGSPHKFRDTFAVNMLAEGMDLFTLSQMLGHSDPRITQKHYVNLVPGYRERMSRSTAVLQYRRLRVI